MFQIACVGPVIFLVFVSVKCVHAEIPTLVEETTSIVHTEFDVFREHLGEVQLEANRPLAVLSTNTITEAEAGVLGLPAVALVGQCATRGTVQARLSTSNSHFQLARWLSHRNWQG